MTKLGFALLVTALSAADLLAPVAAHAFNDMQVKTPEPVAAPAMTPTPAATTRPARRRRLRH